ncbi:MAG TPA: hypothetical protein PLD62_00450 [Candidatus Cloacimonadota bacterium]|nr:hypothetical protein [Candidatus Cloacimonadota bacterium]
MDENLKHWFTGFEKAIAQMKQQERESLFSECGKNCADRWVLNIYRDLFGKVNGDLDIFFAAINNAEGVRGEVIEPGKKYNLYFEKCFCGMHNEGYLNSPFLCECSRQSVLYVFKTLLPEKNFGVELCSTVLQGGDECKLTITMN